LLPHHRMSNKLTGQIFTVSSPGSFTE